jgi:hypothetical protein
VATMIHSGKTNGSKWQLFAQLLAMAALALFVSAPIAHAQGCPAPVNVNCKIQIPAGTSLLPFIGGYSGTGGIDAPCYSYPSYGCIIVATFNANSYNYYYVTSGGSSNGFSGHRIDFQKDGVYQGYYTTTNNSNDPGTIVVVAALNSTYTFLGGQYYGNNGCVNQNYFYFGPTVTYSFQNGSGAWYGVGIPYRGSC